MRKRIAGCALIAATAIFTFQLPNRQIVGENQTEEKILLGQVQILDPLLSASNDPLTKRVWVTLVKTIDGDTLKVRLNGKVETVRYLLIDTPESKKPGMCVQPFALEAFVRNNELVNSGTLTIEWEQEKRRDAYGRLLAYVYVNGHSVQETLLKEGFARVGYNFNPPYKYLALYQRDEGLAKRSHLNIWGKPNFVTRWGFNGCAS
ncbi:thermonuclease family protein [Neobacillus vireti]|uniref:thermonuclease family protein n=1 Tax=Neobacillus vireti TaxID=220686 RepID=UPI002FFE2380